MVNPYSAYKKQSVQTMTPVEVVIKLYSEIERQLAIGVSAVEDTKDVISSAVELCAGKRVSAPARKRANYTF